MNKKIIVFVVVAAIVNLIAGCGGRTVKRLAVEKTVDLSGVWNDTDSRLVAEEMIQDCVKRPWLDKFNEKNRREPVVIIGTVINRSHEHINAQLFIKNLEKSLLNTGKITFIASKQEREDVRDERDDQQRGQTAKKTVKPVGEETGADFIMQGMINSVKDELKDQYVILYQVSLELIDLTNNQKVWIGQKEIKKYVKKSRYSL